MDKKKIAIILLLTAAIGGILYYLFFVKKISLFGMNKGAVVPVVPPTPTQAVNSAKSIPALSQSDNDTFDTMVSYFSRVADQTALAPLLNAVANDVAGSSSFIVADRYKIAGKVTKSGAFLSEVENGYLAVNNNTYAGGRPGSDGFSTQKNTILDTLNTYFNTFKQSYIQKELVTGN